jgi:hypothetical protein
MYRHRWLEEYHHTENLKLHMPDGINIPHLDQIPQGTPSPAFSAEFCSLDEGFRGHGL